MKWHLLLVLGASLALSGCRKKEDAGSSPSADAGEILRFSRDGQPARALAKGELEAAIPAETATAFDPYYRKAKTFKALPLGAVLAKGFPGVDLRKEELVLRARDGYAVPISGERLLEKGGYLAVADIEVPGWEPIGPQRANPGPYYLIWREPGQESLESHPRPWQLASIEIARFEALYPHVVPPGLPDDAPAMRGLRIFRGECIRCHAMNREGGRVGPELNVPKSIVEYRPEEQIRAYIVNPLEFRYGNMPAHPNLRGEDLDALIAYFHAMKSHKHDPEKKAP